MADDGLERARRAYEAGNLSGVWDALAICEQERLPLPGWLNGALGKALMGYFHGSKDGAKWFRSWKQDLLDYDRWDSVASADDELGGIERAAEEAKTSDEKLANDLAERVFPFRWTDERIYSKARELLALGGHHCSPGAIKASYLRVAKREKEEPTRYYFRNLPGFLAHLFWNGKLG